MAAGLAIVAGFAIAKFGGQGEPPGVLAVGAVVPTVALPATTGGTLSLDQLRGTKIVVYFYEGAG